MRAAWIVLVLAVATTAPADVADQVDVFAGTAARAADFGTGGGAGNTFPGAVLPFGMLAWSPDTFPGRINFAGGYSWDESRIRGFSLTHLSGTGCAVFQDVPILPTVVPVTVSPSVAGSYDVEPRFVPEFSHDDETGAPGYYRVRLDPGTPQAIDVELTARTRSGIARLTFPASSTASVLVNAGGSAMANGDVALAVSPAGREIAGSVSAGQFCYHRNRYTLYFAMRFSRPFAAWGTWQGQALAPGGVAGVAHTDAPFHLKGVPGSPDLPHTSNTAQAGAWATFDTTADAVVLVRVGVSYVSVAAARRNLDAELPAFDFDRVHTDATTTWNAALRRIVVDDQAPEARTFYTMLYHALLAPTVFGDVDGAYAGMDGTTHQADGWVPYANFSGWDVYRTQLPLLALLDPARTSDMVRSLLANARESGWLPRWPVANGQTDVQVGDPAAQIIAGAWALGARGFDVREALAALVHGATETGTSPNAEYVERQGLADYLRLGWVPHDGTETSSGATTSIFGSTSGVWGSAATTLEYAGADFAIARLAAAAGDTDVYATFLRRAGGWRKLFDRDAGYIVPRYASGAFKSPFDPTSLEGFVEGDAAQYTWLVPFDVAGLARRLGGRRRALARLDGISGS